MHGAGGDAVQRPPEGGARGQRGGLAAWRMLGLTVRGPPAYCLPAAARTLARILALRLGEMPCFLVPCRNGSGKEGRGE